LSKQSLEQLALTTIQKIEKSFSQNEIRVVLEQLSTYFQFDYFTFSRIFPTAITRLDLIAIGNYPQQWIDIYTEKNYIFLDPASQHCLSSRLPFFWKNIFLDKNKKVRAFANDCAKFGLKEGFSISVTGNCGDVSLLSFGGRRTFNEKEAESKKIIYLTHIILPTLHEKLTQICPVGTLYPTKTQQGKNLPLQELTAREIECLLWSAEGKTALEISMIIQITESTVNFHLKNAVVKLDCNNKTHAVAKAILLGLIKNQI